MPDRVDGAESDQSPAASNAAARARPARRSEVRATIAGTIVLLVATPVALWAAYFVRIATSVCSQRECDYTVLTPLISFLNNIPLPVAVLTLGLSILALEVGRRAAWIPYAGIVAMFLLPFLGMFVLGAIAAGSPPESP